MTEIRQAVDYWNANRPLLDRAEQAQHDDVRSFLAQAAGDTGAPWSAITGIVREWLTDEDNADAIRIHLRS
jgi:predicted aconitase